MKTSEMIIAFAGDFVHAGGSVEQKPMRLNAACTAWNIATLPKYQRREALERYLTRYRAENPGVRASSLLRRDREHLIRQKVRRFPRVEKPIVHAEIQADRGRFRIAAASMRPE